MEELRKVPEEVLSSQIIVTEVGSGVVSKDRG